MKKCSVCQGVFQGEECPFGNGEGLPWAENYVLMRKGKMELSEQQCNVARWVLHSPTEHTETILNWAQRVMSEEKIQN